MFRCSVVCPATFILACRRFSDPEPYLKLKSHFWHWNRCSPLDVSSWVLRTLWALLVFLGRFKFLLLLFSFFLVPSIASASVELKTLTDILSTVFVMLLSLLRRFLRSLLSWLVKYLPADAFGSTKTNN